MCGITGLWLFNQNQGTDLKETVRKMTEALSHRGPDDSGVWVDESLGIGLGHRRLSIMDLSHAGHQPMASQSRRFIIVFNGEIYNHIELRSQIEVKLEGKKQWIGNSDTETLLASIEVFGLKEALKLSKGMFAFALWDRENKNLLLARDRFGEKPIYWGLLNDLGIAFSSEISALRRVNSFSNPLDEDAIKSYMHLGYIPAPQCIYKGLKQLPPGHIVEIKANSYDNAPEILPKPIAWWETSIEAFNQQIYLKKNKASSPLEHKIKSLKELLQEAVRLQSISDVPIGCFLSGGIDSSLITALLQESNSTKVRSLTISFPDEPKFNEASYANSIANYLGTNHTEIPLTSKDAQSLIPSLPNIYSEPFADSSQVPTHLLCREARQSGLTVALTGDGADELFGGYNRHRLAPLIHRRIGFLAPPFRRVLQTAIEHAPFKLLGISSDGLAQQKRQKLSAAIGAANSLEALHTVLLDSMPSEKGSKGTMSHLPNAGSPEEQIMLADLINYLPFDILVKVDRAAMAVGLETRAPFLDPMVAKAAWGLPLACKIYKKNGKTIGKWALKELLKDYLPKELFERPKAGFAMPIGSWLRGPLKDWANDLLNPTIVKRNGWFDPSEINLLWEQHLSENYDHINRLWPVLMAHAWLERWE
ncbi:asparagine synthase (glutamine-hydrolyzing) [Prochlorococcus sp. MIT 1341]|uniref:asparagine synthase (glutamine-hydrolyzing) n=1 Tax=Prochlorococcus sp. MIT 1341 TaxID=3096221 RepID=UPI002A761A04|nr:asparagine synthase (glutamine-hydrolyzing) [Prochlorococcus sp. MIT 1341]